MSKNSNSCNQPENISFLDVVSVYEGIDNSAHYEKEIKDTSLNFGDEKAQKNRLTNSIDSPFDEQRANVFDVAAYILKTTGSMTTMKLQKLVYYCQAWSLVWDEESLFEEQIEAWANGPVVKELFNYHRGMFQISSVPIGNSDLLNKDQRETVDAVLKYYGDKPSQWLIDLTHMEEPWKNARTGLPISVRGNKVIRLEDIADYYSSLPADS